MNSPLPPSLPREHAPVPYPRNEEWSFETPADTFRPVPFWWWVGDALTPERLIWQLDQLKEKGVLNAIISYPHGGDVLLDPGDPAVFSPAWWDLLRRMINECKARGMRISFQDYCLLNPMLHEIGRTRPDMQGGKLVDTSARVTGPASCHLTPSAGTTSLNAWAYRFADGVADAGSVVDLSDCLSGGHLAWNAPAGEWLVCVIGFESTPFDPLHPDSGSLAIESFYAPFARECPGELGKTLAISFQDELDFGGRMPFWSPRLLAEFVIRKGYALAPVLPALWHDLGDVTAKVRIDFSDVVTTLLEESYFIPVFRWHNDHGVLFGHDNCGRGCIGKGHASYGDPFRTMRWFSAPGTDDPRLDGPRAFRGLKVNSSIAHLYGRQRVWCECFHSSGWGTSPAAILAALHADFIYGATVVNLHGLYYSTHGSWWEWASPDFHFRQPYWNHFGAFNDYVARLCETLSQGSHVCDVAILYPITSIEAGLNARIQPDDSATPFSEAQAGHGHDLVDETEVHAFGLGQYLVQAGLDFDFIDFQSLERAEIRDGALQVAGESYRVLVLPMMLAVRFSSLEKARDFVRSGGRVLAYNALPIASERMGRNDPVLDGLVQEIFPALGTGERRGLILGDYKQVVAEITRLIVRDFVAEDAPFQVLHRRTDKQDIYFVFNPERTARSSRVRFRTTGKPEQWNAWTGERQCLASTEAGPVTTTLDLRLEAEDATLIVFNRRQAPEMALPFRPISQPVTPAPVPPVELDGLWDFELLPTMDNRFGDYRLPAATVLLGAEARSFLHAPESAATLGCQAPDFGDSAWAETTCSFGQRFWRLGPITPGTDAARLAAELSQLTIIDPSHPVHVDGRDYHWTPHAISLRWGVEDDPFLRDWASGPHGLKSQVPDEFIDLDCTTPGALWFLWTSVRPKSAGSYPFTMGGRASHAAWLNSKPILPPSEESPPGVQSIWNLPHYRSIPRETEVALQNGENPLLLSFIQPAGQRVRAYAAFRPTDFAASTPETELGLRWFRTPGHPLLNARPEITKTPPAGWYRFTGPPGLNTLTISARGACRVWVDGQECPVETISADHDRVRQIGRVTQPCLTTARVALRVDMPLGSFAGDALPEPIALTCGLGQIELGDWCGHGLATYSGTARYGHTFILTQSQLARFQSGGAIIDLGRVAVTAAVIINGRAASPLMAPPWRVDVTHDLAEGVNRIEVFVANTLANHYSVGIPTPYAIKDQTVSGLLGPVVLKSASNSGPLSPPR